MARRTICLSAMAAVAMLACGAHGALLWNDPNALTDWQGKQDFYRTDGVFVLNVQVQFAVYEPGQYALAGGTDPSGGDDYVYAYQVLNTINSSSVEASGLTVGITALSGAHNAGTDTTVGRPGQAGGIVPTSVSLSGSSVRWYFGGDTIDYGEWSPVLLFTSPNPPQWLSGSVADGGLSDRQKMPSPMFVVPEPVTSALLCLGGISLVAVRARRRRPA